ncbi:MAG: dihydrolipoyl dehydrogenase family protein [Thermoanaerobaculia bacterium]
MSRETFDVVVIGGGTAGLVTASGCARLGRRVALVERAELGGECLWTGCVPSKALIATARVADTIRHAWRYGIDPVEPVIDGARVLESMRETQRITQKHDDPDKFRRLGIDVVFGEARLRPRREVAVGGRILVAKDVVLATGSRTRIPDVEGLDETGFVDHVSFLRLQSFPRSVVILGGGAVGVEFAQMLRRFGTEVTLVQRGPSLLPREDAAIRSGVRALLLGNGIDVRLDATAVRARCDAGRKIVTMRGGDGSETDIAAQEIFVATGRRGNVENLGLEETGVRTEKDFVVADRALRTTAHRVWACGDVHGSLLFTHVAAHEAATLVRNILFPGRSAVDYDNVPWAVFTDPEVARVGLTEEEAARELGTDGVRTWTVEMADLDRPVADRATEGFLKVVTTPRGKILGAHALCAGASSLIATIVLARDRGATLGRLGRLVSPYPSLPDGFGKLGASYFQELASGRLGRLARRVVSWTHQ